VNKKNRRPQEEEDHEGLLTRSRALALILIIATGIALYLCFVLVRPFLPALAWALALAVISYPLHRAISARLKNRDVAATLSCFVVAAVIVVPGLFVAQQISAEASDAVRLIREEAASGGWKKAIANSPRLAPLLEWIEERVDVKGGVEEAVKASSARIPEFVKASVWLVTELLITFLVLFYFLRDRGETLSVLQSFSPLTQAETERMMRRISETIRGTVFGTLVVALVQGILGGLMFWILGLPGPILWGAVMALLAIIPVLGAFVIWIPAAIFLALQGEYVKALVLTAWGVVIVGLIDNLLYPALVGNRLRLHTLPVFFAIVGGLFVFGTSGLILGPVVLAVTIALIAVWRERTRGGGTVDEAK
jgi:predicted PurR-regulated permease PerM